LETSTAATKASGFPEENCAQHLPPDGAHEVQKNIAPKTNHSSPGNSHPQVHPSHSRNWNLRLLQQLHFQSSVSWITRSIQKPMSIDMQYDTNIVGIDESLGGTTEISFFREVLSRGILRPNETSDVFRGLDQACFSSWRHKVEEIPKARLDFWIEWDPCFREILNEVAVHRNES
jgi:hypothetical protein